MKRQVSFGWRRNGRRSSAFCACGRLTEPRQIQTGKVARIRERGRQARLKLSGREVQETMGRTVGERNVDSFAGRTVQGGAIGTGGLTCVEMALRR